MKRNLIYLLIAVSLFGCKKKGETAIKLPPGPVQEELPQEELLAEGPDTIPRSSITFILGTDNSEFNQYYTLANHYYRLNADDKTDVVIDRFTSIKEVSDYLRENPGKNDRPYGLVNLVSHGNEFIDLRALVYPKGPRASTENLYQAVRDSILLPLDSTVLDSRSLIYLHGCAVGNNPGLLTALAVAFGSEQTGVRVKASKMFEYYAYLSKNKNPQSIRHYFAKTWYCFYHPDSIPGNAEFVRRFEEYYPGDSLIDWRGGVERRFQSNPGQIYHFSFVVPLTWETYYKEEAEVPLVNTRKRKQEWLDANTDFRAAIEATKVPIDYFQFRYYKPKYQKGDHTVYSLRVQAKGGVMCLIQPVLSEVDSLKRYFVPYLPEDEDPVFFEFSSVNSAAELNDRLDK